VRIASAEYSYPADRDKRLSAIAVGGIGAYSSQCEKTSSFYLGLVVLQSIAIQSGWDIIDQTEQIKKVLEIIKTDEFKQGANEMKREGCDNYKKRLQPAVDYLWKAIK